MTAAVILQECIAGMANLLLNWWYRVYNVVIEAKLLMQSSTVAGYINCINMIIIIIITREMISSSRAIRRSVYIV